MTEWLARYNESVGNFDRALGMYQERKDYSAVIRVYCSQNRLNEAIELIDKSKDPLAAFILARTFENNGKVNIKVEYRVDAGISSFL
jgi:pentatricopeptide repeat protein